MRTLFKKVPYLIVSIIFCIMLFFLYHQIPKENSDININIKLVVPMDDTYEVFYDLGDGFKAGNSVAQRVNQSNRSQVLKFTVPSHTKSIRFDPGTQHQKITIEQIKIKKKLKTMTWGSQRILESNPAVVDIESLIPIHNGVEVKVVGKDPQLILSDLSSDLSKLENTKIVDVLFYSLFILLSMCLFIWLPKIKMDYIVISRVILVVSFITILTVPMFGKFIFKEEQITLEKRTLASNPFLNSQNVSFKTFTEQSERYVDDNFILREQLIRWNNTIKVNGLGVSSTDKVIMGKEGWLFYRDYNIIEDYQGLEVLSEKNLGVIESYFLEIQQWLEAEGIHFYVVVVPEKSSIYPEYLPDYLHRVGNNSRLDQFLAYVQKKSSVNMIDLRPTLMKHKNESELYIKTDTHWNYIGAFYSSNAIFEELQKHMKGMETIPVDYFDVISNELVGDLSTMLMTNKATIDNELRLIPKSKDTFKMNTNIVMGDNNRNERITVSKTDQSDDGYKLMAFGDSFQARMVPYLSLNFNESIFMWRESYDKELIKEEKPDVVIMQLAERYFKVIVENEGK